MEQQNQAVFVVDPESIRWPVTVQGVPVDGGEFASFLFYAQIKPLSLPEYEALVAQAGDGERPGTVVLEENARLLPEVVMGWDGVRNNQGDAVEFTVEALQAQIKGRVGMQLSAALWRAVREVVFGVRLGNFVAPPGDGPSSTAAAPTSTPTT